MKKRLFALIAIVMAACCIFAACGGGSKIADNTEHFDTITKTLKLTKSYEGKKLMSADGIGVATLNGNTTDGDTSNFSLAEGGSVTVRYQGVNTPESTAGVEKWGKAASNFTNERLHAATVIVIESASGGVPEKDSVGQRSLCYVWYKTATDDFKCLNLELVENGYSPNKEDADNAYYSYFQKAEQFARSIELRLYSKLDDPLFDTAVQSLSLKKINEEPDSFTENTKFRLYAYISDKKTASSGAVTLTISQFDEETGKVYSLPLYAGHTASTGNMRIGDLYYIVGSLEKYDSSWQLAGVKVDNERNNTEGEEWSWRSQSNYCLIFDSSHSFYTQNLTVNCCSNVTVRSATLAGTTLTFVGTANQPGEAGKAVEYTFTVTVPETYTDGTIKEGTTLAVSACYQFAKGSNKLSIPSYSNITIK